MKKLVNEKSEIYSDFSLMCLMTSGIKLENERKLSSYSIKSGDLVTQAKGDISEIPGMIISYERDIISFDDSKEARAKMPCGHVISTESMTSFLRSLVDAKKYVIRCPA